MCNGEVFISPMCPLLSQSVHIIHAFFGDIGTFQQCSPDHITEYDYRVNIQDVDPDYYRQIIDKCQGKSACQDLVAKQYVSNDRFGTWNNATEYVMLVYKCVSGMVILASIQLLHLVNTIKPVKNPTSVGAALSETCILSNADIAKVT